jgi:FAD dependent oxidoreductase
MIDHVTPPNDPIPVLTKTDVLVVGGGTAGVAAALAASRTGASAIVVEGGSCLGGTMTAGLIDNALSFTRFSRLAGRDVRGILAEIVARMHALGAMGRPAHSMQNLDFAGGNFTAEILSKTQRHDPEIMKILLVQMLEEANVRVLLRSTVDQVLRKDDRLVGVLLATKAGRRAIRTGVIVDATGDADVAAFSGAAFQLGHPEDGHTEAVTLMFRVGGLEEECFRVTGDVWFEALQRACDAGELRLPEYATRERTAYNLASLRPCRIGEAPVWSINIDMAVGADVTDPWQLSTSQNECMKCVWAYLQFLRKYIPGCGRVYLIDTAELLGVRDSRRIVGDYVLTWRDIGEGRKFSDTIASSAIITDLHDHIIADRPDEPVPRHRWTAKRRPWGPPPGDYYDIPYRCLLPRGIENLLVAGRSISTDYQTVGATRLVPICMQTGQAAGTAAALAALAGLRPRQLDVSKLQAELLRQGADLTLLAGTAKA